MIIVVDVNILISALIKDSAIREIIVKSEQDFCFPEPSMQKIRKYKPLIIEKSGMSEESINKVLEILFQFVRIIPVEELKSYWLEAKRIMEHIDPEDVTFIATALSQEEAIIWSDDKHFERQNELLILKTKNMVDLFYRD